MAIMTRTDAATTHQFDACVIGSGASGSIVAHNLVNAGWDVILVEQGARVSPGVHLLDIINGFEMARARDAQGRWSSQGYPWTACALGGGTVFYGGMSFRYRTVDFDARSFTAPDALDARWPITYDDLREHYDTIEALLGVAREAGVDPTEPPGAPAPLPPHKMSRRGTLLAQAATRLGLRPFPTPLAIHSMPYKGQPSCRKMTCCTDYACPIGAKSDVVTRFLDPLAPRVNFALRTQLKAVALHQSAPCRVAYLECVDVQTHERLVIKARHFVLAANAIQSAALLLRSTSKFSPTGVGNDEDMVGRGLTFKVSEYIRGWTTRAPSSPDDDDMERHLRGLYSTMALTDHYIDSDCPSGLGGLICETNPWTPIPDRQAVLLRLECILADQPMARNRVRLAKKTGEFGLPGLILDYRTHPLDRSRLAYLLQQCERILREAGCQEIAREPSAYMLGSAHLHGTCRAGVDPQTSVVNPDGRVHAMDNVYVVDGGYMPFPGGVNPTLTIQANALRIARRLANTSAQ